MDNTTKAIYVNKNMTSEWLISNGFRYSNLFSDENTDVFTYRFPIHKYENFIVLECELRAILGEHQVSIDVYDRNTINRYAPFYYSEYGKYDKMLKEIWEKIYRELKKLGIKLEENNGDKGKETERKCKNSNKRKSGSGRI